MKMDQTTCCKKNQYNSKRSMTSDNVEEGTSTAIKHARTDSEKRRNSGSSSNVSSLGSSLKVKPEPIQSPSPLTACPRVAPSQHQPLNTVANATTKAQVASYRRSETSKQPSTSVSWVMPTLASSFEFTQEGSLIKIEKIKYPETPIGKAKAAIEKKMIDSLEMSQDNINMIEELSKSLQFKTAKTPTELKNFNERLDLALKQMAEGYKSLIGDVNPAVSAMYIVPKVEPDNDDDPELVEPGCEVIEIDDD